jgi:phosphatidylserine decarboxylase
MVSERYKFAAPPLVLGLLALLPGWHWLAGVLLFLGLFVLYFFRDPDRAAPSIPDAVVSPADGHVVEVAEEALDGCAGRRISIFLSVWDVHVNRSPVAGAIRRVDYRPGRFFAALRSRASAENEQNVIRVATPRGDMVFKQIAGAIARRVICWKAAGDAVALGERIGMIRFGSRMDVWLPLAAEIVVQRGDRVKGGASLLARWK